MIRKMRLMVAVLLVSMLSVLVLGAAPATAANNFNHSILIKVFTFRPNTLTVLPGETVYVRNYDGTHFGIPHSVTAKDGSFDTAPFFDKASFVAPSAVGRYPFYCVVHPDMHGVLFVSTTPPNS